MSGNAEDEKQSEAQSSQQNQQEEQQKKKESVSSAETQQEQVQPAKPATPPRPVIGTPIGKPTTGAAVTRPVIGKPVGQPAQPSSAPQPQQQQQQTGGGSTPAPQRPRIGTPIGKPVGTTAPSAPRPPTATGGQAQAGAPTAPRPIIGRPSVGTPAAGAPRPGVAAPAATGPIKPTVPTKPVESKQDVSRRNFLRAIAVLGGLVAIVQFGALGPYLQGSVGLSQVKDQVIQDATNGQAITTKTLSEQSPSATFVYPRTGDPNVDNDTFRQCVIIQLPKGLTAPADVSATDTSTNTTYVAFSRVCVHLWCLWSYVPSDRRMECPCHGSQYVPGTGPYPNYPSATDQPPGKAVGGPASLQTPPNNMLPLVKIKLNSDGTFSAFDIVGQIGCGQLC